MSKEINLSHVIISAVVSFVSMDTMTNHLCCYAKENVIPLQFCTILCMIFSVQDAQVYLLQELQCKDFLAVMKENHPCIEEKYQVMK